jgi:acyl carrier protein
MNEMRARLVKCFAAVFPHLPPQDIPAASTASVAEWDSLASLTLIMALEEEFGVEVDAEQLETLVSFDAILDHVLHAQQPS